MKNICTERFQTVPYFFEMKKYTYIYQKLYEMELCLFVSNSFVLFYALIFNLYVFISCKQGLNIINYAAFSERGAAR